MRELIQTRGVYRKLYELQFESPDSLKAQGIREHFSLKGIGGGWLNSCCQ